MTAATTATLTAAAGSTETDARTTPLWRTGLRAGAIAAAATTAVAGLAMAAGVPLEIDGEQIPLLGYAQLTLVCAALGVLLAKAARRWAGNPRRAFLVTTLVLTALSFVPDLTAPAATTATRLVLIATHVVAAAIVIPALAARLADR
jgi:hypothetical protein